MVYKVGRNIWDPGKKAGGEKIMSKSKSKKKKKGKKDYFLKL